MQAHNMRVLTGIAAALVLLLALVSTGFAQSADSTRQAIKMKPVAIQKPDDNKTAMEGNPLEYVKMTTSKGEIILELNREKAPVTVANFLSYVDKGFYDSTIFHRVMNGFMIQGGGFTADMKQKPTDEPIINEWQNGLKNLLGTIAMARRGNMPNSATSQFFINVRDNGSLDVPGDGAGYAVFGKVVSGMDVVEKIKVMPVQNAKGHANVPIEPIVVLKAERSEKPEMTE